MHEWYLDIKILIALVFVAYKVVTFLIGAAKGQKIERRAPEAPEEAPEPWEREMPQAPGPEPEDAYRPPAPVRAAEVRETRSVPVVTESQIAAAARIAAIPPPTTEIKKVVYRPSLRDLMISQAILSKPVVLARRASTPPGMLKP